MHNSTIQTKSLKISKTLNRTFFFKSTKTQTKYSDSNKIQIKSWTTDLLLFAYEAGSQLLRTSIWFETLAYCSSIINRLSWLFCHSQSDGYKKKTFFFNQARIWAKHQRFISNDHIAVSYLFRRILMNYWMTQWYKYSFITWLHYLQ